MSSLIHCDELCRAAETCSGCRPFCARKLLSSVRNAHPSLSGTWAASARGKAVAQMNTRMASLVMTLGWIITVALDLGGMHLRNQKAKYREGNPQQLGRLGTSYPTTHFFRAMHFIIS